VDVGRGEEEVPGGVRVQAEEAPAVARGDQSDPVLWAVGDAFAREHLVTKGVRFRGSRRRGDDERRESSPLGFRPRGDVGEIGHFDGFHAQSGSVPKQLQCGRVGEDLGTSDASRGVPAGLRDQAPSDHPAGLVVRPAEDRRASFRDWREDGVVIVERIETLYIERDADPLGHPLGFLDGGLGGVEARAEAQVGIGVEAIFDERSADPDRLHAQLRQQPDGLG
jgi:hypothetical protein